MNKINPRCKCGHIMVLTKLEGNWLCKGCNTMKTQIEMPVKYKLRVICFTPKGQSYSAIKKTARMISMTKKPIDSKVIDDESFYLYYEFHNPKDRQYIIDKKIPKAIKTIRNFYLIIITIVKKANKMGKKGAWKLERTKRWIMRHLRKKIENAKEMEDFVDNISLEDEEEMVKFLAGDIITYKVG